VRELHEVSHDVSLRHAIRLADGRSITALDLQGEYFEQAQKFVADRLGADVDEQTADVLARMGVGAGRPPCGSDAPVGRPRLAAKLRILQGYRDRDGLAWSAAQLQAVDLQYSDVRPEKGL
jgi:proteasome accessory factor A